MSKWAGGAQYPSTDWSCGSFQGISCEDNEKEELLQQLIESHDTQE
jgi:hypothetical protein